MSKAKGNIASDVIELIRPTVEAAGCELWDVEYVKEGGSQILRVTIDKDGEVDIDDCERVHRAIDPILDEADPIPVSYQLEVSSPGIERELRTDAHLDAFIGAEITVKLYTAYENSKSHTGRLISYSDDVVTVESESAGELNIPRSSISKINLYYDFSNN